MNWMVKTTILALVTGCGNQHSDSHGDISDAKLGISSSASELLEDDTKPVDSSGGQTSGGGPGIVCRTATGSLKVTTLDLYEGTVLRNLKYPSYPGSRDEIVTQLADLLSFNPAIKRDLAYAIKHVKSIWEELPPGVTIHASVDLGNEEAVVMPLGCDIEMIGYYETNGKLKIAPDLYKALSPLDQAAFVLHEALYSLARRFSGEENSKRVRELVASLAAQVQGELAGRSRIVTWGPNVKVLVLTAAQNQEVTLSLFNPDKNHISFYSYCGSEYKSDAISSDPVRTFKFSRPQDCQSIGYSPSGSSSSGMDRGADAFENVTYQLSYAGKIIAEGQADRETFALYFD